MIWGRTKQEKDKEEEVKEKINRLSFKKQKPSEVFFAWLPQRLENGRTVWLEYVWLKTTYRQVGIYETYETHRLYACKIEFSPIED